MAKEILSVQKAMLALDMLAFQDFSGKGMRLNELAQQMQLKPSTLYGILQTLVTCGYAEQDENACYHTGKRFQQIWTMNRFRMNPAISVRLEQGLYTLRERTGESVSFYVLENGERINYSNLHDNNLLDNYQFKVDYTMLEEHSIYDYPSGKILVAYANETQLKQIVEKHGYPNTLWDGISNQKQLREAIARLRAQGYAARCTEEVASVSAPVLLPDGRLLGAVGVYMPVSHYDDTSLQCAISEMRAFAQTFAQMSEQTLRSIRF